jgi:hypothetical protein
MREDAPVFAGLDVAQQRRSGLPDDVVSRMPFLT